MTLTNGIALFLAILGALFLFYWWAVHRSSGLRGFVLALVGSIALVALSTSWGHWAALAKALEATALPLFIVCGSIFITVLISISIGHWRGMVRPFQRKNGMLDQAPCPECRRVDFLHEYAVPGGRHGSRIRLMCSDCAAQKQAVFVKA